MKGIDIKDYEKNLPKWMRGFEISCDNLPYNSLWDLICFYIKNTKISLFLFFLSQIIFNAVQILTPTITGQILDFAVNQGFNFDFLIRIIFLAIIGIVYALNFRLDMMSDIAIWIRCFTPSMRYVGRKASENGVSIAEKMSVGNAITTGTTDILRSGKLVDIITLIIRLISLIAVLILMFRKSILLGLIVAIGVPIIVFLSTFFVGPIQSKQEKLRLMQARLTNIATDAVSGIRIIKGISAEEDFCKNYNRDSQELREIAVSLAWVGSILSGLGTLLPGILSLIVIATGIFMVNEGKLSPGTLLAFYFYINLVNGYIKTIVASFIWGTKTWISFNRIRKIVSIKSIFKDIECKDKNLEKEDIQKAFKNPKIYDAESGLKIEPGEFIALVSGSSNESRDLALKLARLIPESRGVYINDIPINQIPIEKVRKNIVGQPDVSELFSGTLRSNISADSTTIFRVENTENLLKAEKEIDIQEISSCEALSCVIMEDKTKDDKLLAALKVAGCEDIIEGLKDSFSDSSALDGLISEKGRSLSGGQRQRVALARAIAKDAQVLVLIQPTSALDSPTEMRIAKRLKENRKEKTTIITTNSPLLLSICDRIIFLEDGKEIISGKHSELYENREKDKKAMSYIRTIERSTGGEI